MGCFKCARTKGGLCVEHDQIVSDMAEDRAEHARIGDDDSYDPGQDWNWPIGTAY